MYFHFPGIPLCIFHSFCSLCCDEILPVLREMKSESNSKSFTYSANCQRSQMLLMGSACVVSRVLRGEEWKKSKMSSCGVTPSPLLPTFLGFWLIMLCEHAAALVGPNISFSRSTNPGLLTLPSIQLPWLTRHQQQMKFLLSSFQLLVYNFLTPLLLPIWWRQCRIWNGASLPFQSTIPDSYPSSVKCLLYCLQDS